MPRGAAVQGREPPPRHRRWARQLHLVSNTQFFTPGKGTTHTYVEREHADAAVDLRKYLRRGGSIVTVIGPTKMGKTVLVGKEAKGGRSQPVNAPPAYSVRSSCRRCHVCGSETQRCRPRILEG